LGDVSGWHVRTHACLSICARPIAIALQGEGKATYLFADIALSDVADLHATLAAYDAAPDGWIEDARPLGRLRLCLKGRVPARVMAP
jgi:predicted metal-binding protein